MLAPTASAPSLTEGTFESIEAKIRRDSEGTTFGGDFEWLCQWFLENAPRYRGQFDEVWLWRDWPDRWGGRMQGSTSSHAVVFATYQSSDCIASAQTGRTKPFDLAICEEAHRLAGHAQSLFATVLDHNKIKASKRLFMREITAPLPRCLYAAFTDQRYLNNKSVLNVLHPNDSVDDLKALTCILNSRLLSLFYKQLAVKGSRTIFPKVVIKNLREFPIPKFSATIIKQFVALADTMQSLNVKLATAKTPREQEALPRQIASTDATLDELVYEAFGLTDAEIAIVEAATSS